MKRIWTLVVLVFTILSLTSCANTTETNEAYAFVGETNVKVDDRSFVLEDTPENNAEDIVIKDFLYTITAEFDNKYDILADIAAHSTSIESEKKHFEDGIYTQSYVIHEITTLTLEQYNREKKDNDEENPLYYYGWEERIEEYNLVEYEIVNVGFTIALSSKANEMGPQWGDGTYNRSFIVGKTVDESSYKIYDFGMMLFPIAS